ncbi:MAG: ATP-binding protein [Sandaracinaceae bacterium]|nr:ATP-binding protein [Sandaracinaceae bacterium]
MLATAHAGCLIGIDAHPVQVEVQVGTGLPGFDIGGCPSVVCESRVRVKSALQAFVSAAAAPAGAEPGTGDLRKTGAGYDLAIAPWRCRPRARPWTRSALVGTVAGELSLSGALRPVRGVLSQLRGGARARHGRAVVPVANAAEASFATGIEVYVAECLSEVVRFLNGQDGLPKATARTAVERQAERHGHVRRARPGGRAACARDRGGGPTTLAAGPPGGGKTMLARRLVTLLPEPTPEEAMRSPPWPAPPASTRAPRAAVRRPLRAPHHTASAAALIGAATRFSPAR